MEVGFYEVNETCGCYEISAPLLLVALMMFGSSTQRVVYALGLVPFRGCFARDATLVLFAL